MKMELSIKVDYLPTWGVYEGVRELLQNGIDAQTEFGAYLTVRHRDGNVLVIENDGATLPHEALLMGHTTKVDRSDLRGKFGEGLKLGTLALVRAGNKIKIRSGSEVWVPSIQRSDKFDADVLVFNVMVGRKAANRVQVEIHGISSEDWREFRTHFLFLDKADENRVETVHGTLLLAAKYAGKLFCGGIFVQNDPDYEYGYDFRDMEVDRDRRMVSKYDVRWAINRTWAEATKRRPDLFPQFNRLLSSGKEVQIDSSYVASYYSEATVDAVESEFKRSFGEDAVPVANLAESEDLGHLGKRGVIVHESLREILKRKIGSIEDLKQDLAKQSSHEYSWHDLEEAERANLRRAIDAVSLSETVTLDTVRVVDFRDPNLQGLYESSEGEKISLSKGLLSDRALTLRVLVHEVAHRHGGDGAKGHVAAIERIWSEIFEGGPRLMLSIG